MSFFKKLTAEFKELIGDNDDKDKNKDDKKDSGAPTQNHDPPRDFNAPYNQQQQQQQQQQYGQYPQQPHGQQQYGGPPVQHDGYGAPPPGPPAPSGPPQLPPGWHQQWDQTSQRWYYVEQATGRTQWEPPSQDRGFGYGQSPPPPPGQQNYGYPGSAPPSGLYSAATHDYSGGPQPGVQQPYPAQPLEKEKKKSNTGKYVAMGAGGLAVGALAGAALSGDSSDEEHGAHYAAQPAYYGAPVGSGAPAPAVALENNPELSSSQRSSLEEARKDYEEARREVAEDSDPSSSDIEELQEAREEYHSEVESAHEEIYDE